VQARTYVDSRFTLDAVIENELATNSTWRTIRTDYIPGQYGYGVGFDAIVNETDYKSAVTNYSYSATTTSFTNLDLPTDYPSTTTSG